jgi:hypothetical protein
MAETMDFRANWIWLGTSGTEITAPAHDVAATLRRGLHRLTHTILEANGKPDCAGNYTARPIDTVVRFIQFSPRNIHRLPGKRDWRSVTGPSANRLQRSARGQLGSGWKVQPTWLLLITRIDNIVQRLHCSSQSSMR